MYVYIYIDVYVLSAVFLWRTETNTTSDGGADKPTSRQGCSLEVRNSRKLLPRLEGQKEEVMSLETLGLGGPNRSWNLSGALWQHWNHRGDTATSREPIRGRGRTRNTPASPFLLPSSLLKSLQRSSIPLA